LPSCDRFKSHPSQCSGIPLCISPQHLERMGDSGDYKTCHISLTKMQSFIHDIWESAHHLLLLPLPLLLFALFLHSSKVNPRPPYGTQLSDLYSNLFLVTLLVLRGIKRCKLPLDFSFFFLYIKQSFFSIGLWRLCLQAKPSVHFLLRFSYIQLLQSRNMYWKF